MTKKIFLCLTALLFALNLFAQQTFTPQTINAFTPIPVQRPILLDSTNLRNIEFSDEILLASQISFPAPERFTNVLTPDADGFFHLPKPQTERAFQLLSFFVSADGFGDGTLTVTSPNMLEVWVDNTRRATQTQAQDSLHLATPVSTSFSGHVNGSRVIIKMLTSSESEIAPAVKIEFAPNDSNPTLVYTFNNTPQRRIQIEDILQGTRVNSSVISPNGRFVRLNFTEVLPGGESRTFVEIYDTRTRRTVLSETARPQLNWLPNSDLLTFVRDGANGRALHTLDPLTMEIRLLADNLPRENLFVAPDGRSVFFTSSQTVNVTNPVGLHRMISINDRLPGNRNRNFIYRHCFDTGLTQQLTFGRRSASINAISDDSRFLLFSTVTQDLSDRPFMYICMFKLDLQTMQVDTIWTQDGYAYSAQFSPDGNHLLIFGTPEAFGGIGLNILPGQIANNYDMQAFIMDLRTREIDPITQHFDPSIASLMWSRNNPQHIYFRTDDRDGVTVYRYNIRTRRFDLLPLPEEMIRNFTLATNGNFAAFTGGSVSNANRAYLLNLRTLESTMIADPFAERLNTLTLGEVRDWSFKSSFGDVIEGRIYFPPNFDPSRTYPLVLYHYSGVVPVTRSFETNYPLHVYAAQDFVVLTLQPSGTIGWGQEFSARHSNMWGGQTAEELIEGVKQFVAEHPFIDPARIGTIGASYGGFMTMYLLTRTDIFAAAVSHAGISSISSYWGEGFWGFGYSGHASPGSFPWNNHDLYVGQSPLFHADRINTPLLLTHGKDDTNVPVGESIQMYKALKLLGRPVELIRIEGEDHSIRQYARRIAFNHSIYAWFTKWLKDDPRWWDSLYSVDK